MVKTAWILQHVPFEGPGAIAPWLLSCGYALRSLNLWENPDFPDVSDTGFVVSMGGPMSVNDLAAFPWLRDEQQWLRDILSKEIPVLGVCLGAQQMAAALGAEVHPNLEKEIGWWPLHACHPSGAEGLQVLHWHGEGFDIPAEGEWLERSDACPHQSFRIGTRALALQYHLETTSDSLNALISHCREELTPARYVQTESVLLEGFHRYHSHARKRLDVFLTALHTGNW